MLEQLRMIAGMGSDVLVQLECEAVVGVAVALRVVSGTHAWNWRREESPS